MESDQSGTARLPLAPLEASSLVNGGCATDYSKGYTDERFSRLYTAKRSITTRAYCQAPLPRLGRLLCILYGVGGGDGRINPPASYPETFSQWDLQAST